MAPSTHAKPRSCRRASGNPHAPGAELARSSLPSTALGAFLLLLAASCGFPRPSIVSDDGGVDGKESVDGSASADGSASVDDSASVDGRGIVDSASSDAMLDDAPPATPPPSC